MSIELAPTISGAPARSWKPYPAYKDSGVEWLGKVPEHWEIIRLKHLAGNDINVVQTGPFGAQLHASDYVDNGVPLILIRNVNNLKIDDSDIPKISEKKAESLSSYRLEIDDIVFSRVGSIGRIAIVTEREKGWLISGQMLRIRIENPNLKNDFALYVFSSEVISEFVSYKSVGSTRDSINTEILRNVPVLIPPIPEQFFITRYLDDRTQKIDSHIEKKQKLIDLLKEERTAVINQAVTKGLDPRAPMRDSGVEWLGEIPKHWKIKKGKYLFKILNGFAPEQVEFTENENNCYFRVDDLNNDKNGLYLNSSKAKILAEDSVFYEKGIILFPKRGAAISTNKLKITFTKCLFDTNLMGLLIYKELVVPEFIAYYLLSRKLDDIADTSTIPQINNKHMEPLIINVPPLKEQTEIIKFIESESAKIDSAVSIIEKEIVLLQEYRTALISEVVTGKIDVREAI